MFRFNVLTELQPLSSSGWREGVVLGCSLKHLPEGYRQRRKADISASILGVSARHIERFRTTIRMSVMRFFFARAQFSKQSISEPLTAGARAEYCPIFA